MPSDNILYYLISSQVLTSHSLKQHQPATEKQPQALKLNNLIWNYMSEHSRITLLKILIKKKSYRLMQTIIEDLVNS